MYFWEPHWEAIQVPTLRGPGAAIVGIPSGPSWDRFEGPELVGTLEATVKVEAPQGHGKYCI